MFRGYQPEEHLDPRLSSEGREPNTGDPPKIDEVREQASNEASQSPGREPDRPGTRTAETRTVYELRGRTYRLRNSEIATMVELGKFRAVAREDLAEFAYGGNDEHIKPDVENLVRQGLVEMKSIPHEERGHRQLLTLSKTGYRFLTETQSSRKEQALYHGFVKPREAHHDADLYRLYQKAAAKIAGQGGHGFRVVLDYELKKHLNRDLSRLGKDPYSTDDKHTIARKHGLQVVRGKIPVPDVRIEYETPDGERARVDLELATGTYSGRHLSRIVGAGFSLYAHPDDISKLRRILDRHELKAEILSL